MTLNPSRNTLPLAKYTKSIDLDHLKSTQHSLATQHQKYSKLRRDYTCLQYKLKSIQLQSYSILFENPKLDVNVQILKSTLSQLKNSNLFLFLVWKHKQTIYIFQRLVKAINEGAYSVGNHLKHIQQPKQNSVRIFKEQSVETTKQPIVWFSS